MAMGLKDVCLWHLPVAFLSTLLFVEIGVALDHGRLKMMSFCMVCVYRSVPIRLPL
jgi:hypothetical protein